MSSTAKKRHTYAEYLALEEASDEKHEFLDGVINSLGHPRRAFDSEDRHAVLCRDTAIALSGRLGSGEFRVFHGVPETGLATYPDVSVICGEREAASDDRHSATNPILLVEVLSNSSERYDRGEKFRHYRQLPSLRTYVLISQDSVRVEVFERQDDGAWRYFEVSDEGVVPIASLNVELDLAELYRNAEFLAENAEEAAEDSASGT